MSGSASATFHLLPDETGRLSSGGTFVLRRVSAAPEDLLVFITLMFEVRRSGAPAGTQLSEHNLLLSSYLYFTRLHLGRDFHSVSVFLKKRLFGRK